MNLLFHQNLPETRQLVPHNLQTLKLPPFEIDQKVQILLEILLIGKRTKKLNNVILFIGEQGKRNLIDSLLLPTCYNHLLFILDLQQAAVDVVLDKLGKLLSFVSCGQLGKGVFNFGEAEYKLCQVHLIPDVDLFLFEAVFEV